MGHDPLALKRDWLQRLARGVGAVAAAWIEWGHRPDGPSQLAVLPTWGSELARNLLERTPSLLPSDYFYDLTRVQALTGDFGRWELIDRERIPRELQCTVWDTADLAQALSLSVEYEGMLVSSIHLYLPRRYATLDALPANNLREEAGALTDAAQAFFRAEQRRAPRAADLLVDVDGQPVAATTGAEPLPALIVERVRRLARTRSVYDRFVLERTEVQLRLLRGPESERRVLVSLCPYAPLDIPPLLAIPPATRRVAAMVARGMSNEAAAIELNRSVHTVRSHLKNAYDALGVTSRAELARVVYGQEANSPGD